MIHFLTTDSIEERVWETLRLKKSLFAGVFDSPADEVSFAALGRKSVLQAVKEVFADQPVRPKPAAAPPPPAPAAEAASPAPDFAKAAAGLIEAGVHFLESLAANAGAEPGIASLLRTDPATKRQVLAIPVPEALTGERLAGALAGLLNVLRGDTAR